MRFGGGDLDDLIRDFDRMYDDIDDDVDEVLQNNAIEFSADTVKSAKEVMNKGYWTGNLAREIEDSKVGKLKYAITSKAGYSGFLEYGTRYMEPETFMFPVYEQYTKQVRADLERLIED
ncbi:HK97-gp10 family putative phage morphogenesis protein [Staphylococcus hominis]|uniref:HK97-gp10 family putative phage morphogenesis protein n=1 Tax=Staphylococcus hominis TaxID=1290 RepID=UPI0022E72633|nr:HK97-gp10 family putative phage morphogenesis protein [Staphylococcus hominis]